MAALPYVLNLVPNRMKCPIYTGPMGGQSQISLVPAEDAANNNGEAFAASRSRMRAFACIIYSEGNQTVSTDLYWLDWFFEPWSCLSLF